MSRDEIRSRAGSERPVSHDRDGRRALWPVDGQRGGTWVAASEAGLTLALLNVNLGAHEPPSVGPRTRGEIIPRLVGAETAGEAVARMHELRLDDYRPFRLVAIGSDGVMDARWDRVRLLETGRRLAPACFVSAGIGDHFVEPRLMLFESMLRGPRPSARTQDAFHAHVWPGHEHVSVMMSRESARTVSVTAIEAEWSGTDAPAVTMTHRDDEGETHHELGAPVLATT